MSIIGSIAGGLGSFDSELDDTMANPTTNAELTLFLRIHLQQVPGGGTIADHDGTSFNALAWTPGAWNRFVRKYRQDAQAFWHGKFWLRTPDSFNELDRPGGPHRPVYRPNIWCRFELSVQDTPAGAHKTIRVARLIPTPGLNAGTFRSNDSLYDDHDLGVASYVRGGHIYHQRTFIHEVGHALGLPHIGVLTGNPACPVGNTNIDNCYGVVPAERRNIMGFGMSMSRREARPWLARVVQHTGTNLGDWNAFMHRVYPRPK